MEEEKMTEEEILEFLKDKLKKEVSASELCKSLNIGDIALLGYVEKLKKMNVNVSISNKRGDMILTINNGPDFSTENTYVINDGVNDTIKIGVISDTRFGSKNEQIELLNDIYKRFAADGVKYVIVCGNLLEGKYKAGEEENTYGKSLITNDAFGQVDHLIDYFPKVEGIQTLFITGKTDHSWGKKLNVGEHIAQYRRDMTFLGAKSCTIKFNNSTFRVENLKKTGEGYTIAYSPQKYSRSMSSYENYDIIFLGGTLSAQEFPVIRDTRIFTIPSIADRTPKMKDSYQLNVMGAYEFEATFDKMGKLKRLVPQLIPYYRPSDKNYSSIIPLDLRKDDDDEFVSHKRKVVEKNEMLARVDRLYRHMKKEEKFVDLKDKFGLSNDDELFGVISVLKQYGRPIDIVDINGELIVQKQFQERRHSILKPPKEELTQRSFGVVSDTHYGSIWCQPSMVNTFCYEAYNRGITDMFHVGDISDGDYHPKRPEHVTTVFKYGATGQVEYTAKVLPKYPGMRWYGICGSHDQSHSFQYGPFDFGKELAKLRKDFTYLGLNRAFFYYDKCKMEIFHPGGGTSRILSTKPQNGIDQLFSGTKPNISLRGHYHKVYYMLYRNIHVLLCPCNVDQSSFMMKQEIPNLMGDYFVTIWYDENGDIHYIETEPMLFSPNDVRERDWENPTRYMKNKILTPRKN